MNACGRRWWYHVHDAIIEPSPAQREGERIHREIAAAFRQAAPSGDLRVEWKVELPWDDES